MSQGKRINITPGARADLEDIYIYGFLKFGEKTADAYIDRFYTAFDMLKYHEVGLHRDEIKAGLCSLPVASHAIWFFPGAEQVLIARVLHQARDFQNSQLWL